MLEKREHLITSECGDNNQDWLNLKSVETQLPITAHISFPSFLSPKRRKAFKRIYRLTTSFRVIFSMIKEKNKLDVKK